MSALVPGATAVVEGLDGKFTVLSWDAATVRLRSQSGTELRAGRLRVRVLAAPESKPS